MHFLGQASWHAPQSTQAEEFIILFLSSNCVIHPTLHTLSHVPQAIHSDLLIILGILTFLYKVCLQDATVTSNTLVKKGNLSLIILKFSPSFKNLAVPSSKNPVPIYLYPITS